MQGRLFPVLEDLGIVKEIEPQLYRALASVPFAKFLLHCEGLVRDL